MFYASCLFCKNPCYKNIINLEDLLFPCHESLQGRIQNAVYKRKKHLKELIPDRGTEKIESSMAIGRVHLLRILFICDLVNSITHNKDCLWSLYIGTTDPSTCHFSGAPCHPPGLRAGSFFDEQAIVEVSFLRSMLVRSSKRDHMLFTWDTIVNHIMSGIS